MYLLYIYFFNVEQDVNFLNVFFLIHKQKFQIIIVIKIITK